MVPNLTPFAVNTPIFLSESFLSNLADNTLVGYVDENSVRFIQHMICNSRRRRLVMQSTANYLIARRRRLLSVCLISFLHFTEARLTISLRKQPPFHEVATWTLPNRRLSNERRNSILMTFSTQILVVLMINWNFLSTNQKHYQDLGSERHQYGISALVTQTSFCEGSIGDLVKRRLFSQATHNLMPQIFPLSTQRCPLRFRNRTPHTKVISARHTSTFCLQE